jgi:hypothetical protein
MLAQLGDVPPSFLEAYVRLLREAVSADPPD